MTTDTCPTSPEQAEQFLLESLNRRCTEREFDVLRHAVPVLAELLAQAHDHPMARLYASVREVVVERCPVRSGEFVDALADENLEQHVAMLCEIMEELRCAALQSGTWSDTPCPEQFFG